MTRTLIPALCLFLVSNVLGAAKVVKVGEKAFHVGTGTPGGSCHTRRLAGGAREILCHDGANVASLSTASGCLDSTGRGYCALGPDWQAGQAGSQLTCTSRPSIFLLVGPEAACTQSGGTKRCISPDGVSLAEADCDSGCRTTWGAGACCSAGITGCPPEVRGAGESPARDGAAKPAR